jgi:cytochrome c oxidase subunit 2
MAAGKDVYEKQCAVCHQPEGQGLAPVFPALAGSKIVTGPLLSPRASCSRTVMSTAC